MYTCNNYCTVLHENMYFMGKVIPNKTRRITFRRARRRRTTHFTIMFNIY